MSFSQLWTILNDYDDLRIEDADDFFSNLGIGNRLEATDRPHERYCEYESLLKLLQQRNPEKYLQIHKGTPFYFLSWLAFDLRNYEKALYYLDAAIQEDIKNASNDWTTLPAPSFLKLISKKHAAQRTVEEIRNILSSHINQFNSISGLPLITLEDFIKKFVENEMQTAPMRTIISAFYVFLLEYEERRLELRLKSSEGCSMGPILTHLFSGGLIFESLLKYFYSGNKTLGCITKDSKFKEDFDVNFKTSANSLEKIIGDIPDNSLTTAFTVTARIRNTTGHNLAWDNIFNSPDNYETLANQVVNAILYVIEKKFITGASDGSPG
ncbi:MAG: hypothetical protein ABFR90_09965 [Planctomycetota bacterium]